MPSHRADPVADRALAPMPRVADPLLPPHGALPVQRTRREVLAAERAALASQRAATAARVAADPSPSRRERREAERHRRRVARRRDRRRLPQLGIAGALGLVTIALPVAGSMVGPHDSRTQSAHVAELEPAPHAAADAFAALPMALTGTPPPVLVPPPVVVPLPDRGAQGASREQDRSALPGCDGVTPTGSFVNGQLPDSVLCTLWDPAYRLRADAAVALAELNAAFTAHFGHPLTLSDAYRSLDRQRQMKSLRRGFAAEPGTSEHGWGLAVDLAGGVETAGSPYQWLRRNAPAFGWDNPAWARPGGSGPREPWHWEYVPGTSAQRS